MKKNKIFSGLSAKLALAVVALTSALFTSCEKEDFSVTFETKPAQAIITGTVIDVKAGSDVTSKATFSANVGEAVGNKITIIGNKDIAKQEVSVTVKYTGTTGKELTGNANVGIDNLKAGAEGNYSVTFLVYEDEQIITIPGDIITSDYEVSEVETETASKRGYITGNYTHSHGGHTNWITNETEYLLNVAVPYSIYVGTEVIEQDVKEESSFVTTLIQALNKGIKAYDAVHSFQVSAWSLYTAWADVTTTTTKYEVKKIVTKNDEEPVKTVVATFTTIEKAVIADHEEIEHPDHSHAYIPGHGHSHGDANAGGGIVMPD